MSKQRITLYIDSNVWQAFRILCLSHKTSASGAVERWMEDRVLDTNLFEELRAQDTEAKNDPQNDPHN